MNALPARPADHQQPPPIGGFFESHSPDGCAPAGSLLAAWTFGRHYAAFVNARSALAALVARHRGAQVWLPAFLCRDLAQAAPPSRRRFYGVGERFEPDLGAPLAEAAPGDILVVVAYFGLPASASVRAALARRGDLLVVEDRAQALDAGPPLPGAWTLFSPRKLLGVADGGLLVAPPGEAPPQPGEAAEASLLWRAPQMRREDPLGLANGAWHAVNQAKEAAMTVGGQAITAASLRILAETALPPLAAARLANWRRLDARLRPWSALADVGRTPPLGYVLRLPSAVRARLLKALHGERIFAAVHWPDIAGPVEAFPREAGWTHELITLPCDHRYGPREMERIAIAVAERLGQP